MDSAISSSLVNNNQQKFLQQCSPIFVEYQLMREFVLFQQQNLSHIYIVPSAHSAFKWFGVIFVDYGLYQGAVLKFTLNIPQSYPDSHCPKVVFDPIPFHPFVNPMTGELNVENNFPNWKSNSNKLWEVILHAKRVFHKYEFEFDNQLNLSLISNMEAVKLYKNNINSFKTKISQSIDDCYRKLNDNPTNNDPNAIVFGNWNPKVHEELKSKLLSGVNILDEVNFEDPAHPSATGLSWVDKGTLFSKLGS